MPPARRTRRSKTARTPSPSSPSSQPPPPAHAAAAAKKRPGEGSRRGKPIIDLVLDALVKQEFFFPVYDEANRHLAPWEMVSVMYHRVRGFIASCDASGYRVHWVMDCGWKSEEAHEKWRSRREEEVAEGFRNFPIGLDSILGDVLQECGQRVYRAEGLDGDDVVAKLAQELGPNSLILSADRDMFRYVGLDNPADRVMADFTFEPITDDTGDGKVKGNGYRLRLIRSHNPTMRPGVTKRWLSDVPYDPEEWLTGGANKLMIGIRNDASDVVEEGHDDDNNNEEEEEEEEETSSSPPTDPKQQTDQDYSNRISSQRQTGGGHPRRRRRRRPRAPVPLHAMGYVRGACSPHVRRHGNLHVIARPLRAAAYHLLGTSGAGEDGAVREVYPTWCEETETVAWIEEPLTPDARLAGLFDGDGREALEWLKRQDPAARGGGNDRRGHGNRRDDEIRKFARCVLVAEMVDSVHGGGVLAAARRLSGGEAEAADLEAERARARVKARVAEETEGKEAAEAVVEEQVEEEEGKSRRGSRLERRLARFEAERWEFPPRTRVGSYTCAEPDCRNEYVVDGRERKRMLERGFKTPKRCPACRRAGKSYKNRLRFNNNNHGGVGTTPSPSQVKKRERGRRQRQRQRGRGGGGGGDDDDGGSGGGGEGGAVDDGGGDVSNNPKETERPRGGGSRWTKAKKATKAKARRSQPKAGMFGATLTALAACR